MERLELRAVPRLQGNKGALNWMRSQGHIPGVVYGRGQESATITLDTRELKQVLNQGGTNALINLIINGENKKDQDTVMLKEIQRDPIKKDHFLHVDLIRISLEDKIEVSVPLNPVGEPQGAKEGGFLQVQMREIMIKSLPMEIPEHISVNIESLNIGDSLHVKDIELPKGVEILEDLEEPIVSVLAPSMVEEEEEVVEEEEEIIAAETEGETATVEEEEKDNV